MLRRHLRVLQLTTSDPFQVFDVASQIDEGNNSKFSIPVPDCLGHIPDAHGRITTAQRMEMELLEIYDAHYDRVKKFIRRMVKDEWVAEDLIQETFIRVEKNRDTVQDPSKLSSWVFRIAYNLCLDHFRSRKSGDHQSGNTESPPNPFMEMPVQKELEQLQMGACVREQIDLLPEQQRIVLILYDLLGFRHNEISEILNITEENAKVRLHRARKSLKSILEKKCTFELDERNVLVCEPVKK